MRAPHRLKARGQSLAEFALVLPVFLLVLFALIDMGRAVYTWNTLSQAAREGARLGAVQAGWINPTGRTPPQSCTVPMPPISPAPASACPTTGADLQSRVTSAANRMAVGLGALGTAPGSSVAVTCTPGPCSSGTKPGDAITVQVTYQFEMLTPIVAQVFKTGWSMGASATMVVN